MAARPTGTATATLRDGIELTLDDVELTLVGAGRSGSFAAVVAAMLGAAVRVYDFDTLAPENAGRQLYPSTAVSARRPKVEALGELVGTLASGARFTAHAERFTGAPGQPLSPLVALCVDTMRERRRLWEALASHPALALWLDLRLGDGVVRLHEVEPHDTQDVATYEASFYDDDLTAPADDCDAGGSAHAAAAGAALLLGAVRGWLAGARRPRWVALDVDRWLWTAGPRRAAPGSPG